ncbi:hypothetical protein OBBRIDRAFT_319165 [Obba rivulosa]|uniref:Uncharacterized protein n=1 Tax=Obba rivulosa TaxID=1052685 RepID=A0A8E2J2N1_9APHY|nr:hypothetical protein OBBRIDRAFT_319165 [Obba rivulosa]
MPSCFCIYPCLQAVSLPAPTPYCCLGRDPSLRAHSTSTPITSLMFPTRISYTHSCSLWGLPIRPDDTDFRTFSYFLYMVYLTNESHYNRNLEIVARQSDAVAAIECKLPLAQPR